MPQDEPAPPGQRRGDVLECDHCKSTGGTLTLKRCGGCATMLYCSKACQKAAWGSHKSLCRQLHPNVLQNPSPVNVANIARKWVNIHHQSFKALLDCTVYLSGGVTHAFSAPRGIVCLISMRPDWDGNPAAPFHLLSFALLHKDESSVLNGQWDSLMDGCREYARGQRFGNRSGPTPVLAGIIPIVWCMTEDNDFVVNTFFPIYHTHVADDGALNARTRIALTGVVHHCRNCLDRGLVYEERPGGPGGCMLKLPGWYRQKGRKWKWEVPMPGDQEFVTLWQEAFEVAGMTNLEAWKVYDEILGRGVS
ncbi:hypothetical protein OH76DRAFT_126974 [Lentinus brumalis]|uniref:MYND-type domain-containing protein n=1 Tax=Lentinus brumalis TaxID=2498619 RepID=A0A371DJX3_9APHY|nr:hypothetical protein OH76DRAFT_126974 [Polyporus brumalis]